MDIVRSILSWFVRFAKLPKRTITRDDGKPYLERWYLCGEAGGLKYFPEGQTTMRWWQKALTRLPCVYLHRFVASDDDEELHNHPWEATSLILAGGYLEERRVDILPEKVVYLKHPRGRTIMQDFTPGMLNYIFADTFHKVTLIEADAWTLIVCGKKVGTWGFWSPVTGTFLHWKEHMRRREATRPNAKGGQA
jgi:hypothetical protein